MKAVAARKETENIAIDWELMPEHDRDAMCRTLIGCINRLFEDPKVREDYADWKRKREQTRKEG